MSRDQLVKDLHQHIDILERQLPGAVDGLHGMTKRMISKGHDYSSEHDPLSNLYGSEELDVPPHRGVLIRMRDKWQRIKNFNRIGRLEVKDESIIDTLLDLAVYCVLLTIVWVTNDAREEAEDKDNLTYEVKGTGSCRSGGRF